MKFDELAVLTLIYSGLMIYFMMPFDRNKRFERPCAFSTLYKGLNFHKKTQFAVTLFILLLTGFWFGFK
ncbi:hypothetical protein [Lysinibacillus sp. NPDC047702]|uniref:hypothetical protein n=1 Tax=unclassified Lysinibacillus TaxID=2636778 RepID=UPI003D06348C